MRRTCTVNPTYVVLNGQDPVAFIISNNVTRRHLSKGQQAMAVAKARLLSNRSFRDVAETANISKARVVQASAVIEYASDIADSVLVGVTPLNNAYQIAQTRKKDADSEAGLQAFLKAETHFKKHLQWIRDNLRSGQTLGDLMANQR